MDLHLPVPVLRKFQWSHFFFGELHLQAVYDGVEEDEERKNKVGSQIAVQK